MILLKTLLLLLKIGVTDSLNQDTTSTNPNCYKKAQQDFTTCYTKQFNINNKVVRASLKLDSIEYKWDKLMELIKNDTIQ